MNYSTFTREKINDFVSFPLVLNFNNYMNGYDGIKNKFSDDPDEEFFKEKSYLEKKKVQFRTNFPRERAGTPPSTSDPNKRVKTEKET